MLGGEPSGDERPMARLGIALDAEQRARPGGRQLSGQALDPDWIEDLLGVAPSVLGRQIDAGPLADTLPRILRVLKMP